MSPDKLGRYMKSDEFLQKANTAIKKAVSELEAKVIKPAYVVRESGTDEERVKRAPSLSRTPGPPGMEN
jgi:hypothetical protein